MKKKLLDITGKKTVAKVKEGVFWFSLLSDVQKYSRSCDICKRHKSSSNRPQHKLRLVELEEGNGKKREKHKSLIKRLYDS